MTTPNTLMITPNIPVIGKTAAIVTANTVRDGTGTTYLALTGGVNGTRIDKITVAALGTNAATDMIFYINDGLGVLAADNSLAHAITLGASTLSQVAADQITDVTITQGANVVCPIPYLPAGQKLNIAIGTAAAGGWQVTVYGGNY